MERAVEIRAWLTSAQATEDAWVAIDDMDLAVPAPGRALPAARFVLTDDENGLTRPKAEEALAKLMAQLRD